MHEGKRSLGKLIDLQRQMPQRTRNVCSDVQSVSQVQQKSAWMNCVLLTELMWKMKVEAGRNLVIALEHAGMELGKLKASSN